MTAKIITREKFPYCSEIGGGNDPPRPFVEVPIGEFWYQQFFRGSEAEEYRQVFFTEADRKSLRLTSCRIFWFFDAAYMIVQEGKTDYSRGGPAPHLIDVKCYRVGCTHEWTETTPRMFEHVHTCSKCAMSYSTDSSG